MKVSEIMQSNPVCVTMNENLSTVAQEMKKGDFGAILINDGDKTIGILTDRDIVIRALANGNDITSIKAKDIMSKQLISCNMDDTLENAAKKMEAEKIRRLPVMDTNSKAIGIISLGDIAVAKKGKETGAVFEALEKISEP